MTGNNKKTLNIFLMGESTGHISYAITELGVRDIVIVSSKSTYEQNKGFLDQLEQNGVKIHEKITVDPFAADSVVLISTRILEVYQKYHQEGFEIRCGLTGGTNLMAIAMGLAALVTGARCHYVVFNNNENRLVNISSFADIKKRIDFDNLNVLFQEGSTNVR